MGNIYDAENLKLLPFDDDIGGSEVILEGIIRDQNALQKFISSQPEMS